MFEPIERTSVKVVLKFNGKPVACIPTQCLPDGTLFVRANDCPDYRRAQGLPSLNTGLV